MTTFKVTANHKTEPVRIALCATADDAAAKVATLEAAGHWQHIEIVPFVPVYRNRVAR